MILLSLALGLIAAVLWLPTVSDVVSLLRILVRARGGRGGPRRTPAIPAEPPRFLFLVPAHDEELLLARCLDSLRRLRYPRERVDTVVIADNCSDRTADIALGAGVRCLVRTAPNEPGKPRAISWALSVLPVRDYDALVIVDADTEVDQDLAAHLAASGPLAHRVLQPYSGILNPSENALTRMAAVQAAADYDFAYVLKTRAGLNVPLSVGMCIGSGVLAANGWTAHSLCEDWELYAVLTERGVRIEGVPDAKIRALEASTLREAASQRRRWTAGKLTVLGRHAGPLLRSRSIGLAQKLDGLAALSVMGPVAHLGAVAVAVAAALLLRPPGAPLLVTALLLTLLRPVVYTLAAICSDPEPVRAALAFAYLPVYAIWRAGITASALAMLGDKPWVRTQRHVPPRTGPSG